MTSLSSFNTKMEWSRKYFDKIRHCFWDRKVTDNSFYVAVTPEDDYNDASARFELKFTVLNQLTPGLICENMTLTESQSQIRSYAQGMDLIFKKVSDHCRLKNKEHNRLQAERDESINQKLSVMRDYEH